MFLMMMFLMSGLFWVKKSYAAQLLNEGPVSASALIGENAQFRCNGSGMIIAWIVDGFVTTDSVIVERGITPDTMTSSGTVQSTLTVPATLENNGTTVQCGVLSLNGGFAVSDNATLNVLPGIGPVVNVRFTPSFSAVLWDTPATAGVLSGLSYIVIVMNNNTGQVIISATTNNTIYPLPGAPTPCQYYTANVTAFSSEYYSESVVIGQRTTGDYYGLESVSIAEVAYFNTSHCAVTFMIDVQKRNSIVQTCPDQELTAVTYPKTDMTDRNSHKEVVIAETGFKEYTAYVKIGYQCLSDVMILDANDIEVGIMTIPFSSFNIQSCFVSTVNTNILVKCAFFINSTATGFVVVENDVITFNRTLHRLPDDSDKGSVNITGLPAGEYSLRVYDSKIDFVNNKEPAYEHFETLAFTSQLQSSETVLSTATYSLHSSVAPSPPGNINSNVNTIILATSVTAGLLILLVILILIVMLITCMAVTMRKRLKMIKTGVIDHVPIDDNPAYITMKRITLNKNTAYETVNITSHDYETVNITSHN